MANRSIGIDIGRYHVRVVQMARTSEGFRVERTFGMQTRRSTDSPVDILRQLTGVHGFDRKADVAVSLPHHAVFFADAEINASTLKKLAETDNSILRDNFPIPGDEAIVQVCSTRPLENKRHSVLVAATSSELLQEELHLLGEARIRPTVVDTAITAAHTALAVNHPEAKRGIALLCCVDEWLLSLAIAQDGEILMVRNIPIAVPRDYEADALAGQVTDVLSREVDITWRKLFDVDPDTDLHVFLVCAPKTAQPLAAMIESEIGCRTTVVDPYARIGPPAETEAGFPICVAEGLALRMLLPAPSGRINFLTPYKTRTTPRANVRRESATCGVLLTAIVAVWIIGMFLRLSHLESRYAKAKAHERDIFRQTLPEEKGIVNPLAQLQQKLDSFRDDCAVLTSFQPGRLTPLEVLQALSAHRPPDGSLVIDDLLIASDSVRVIGNCDSFAALSDWQRTLEAVPGFDIVDGPNPNKEMGKVLFTLSLSTRRTVP
jgi:Tfp pilus assembly PilM family ATPase